MNKTTRNVIKNERDQEPDPNTGPDASNASEIGANDDTPAKEDKLEDRNYRDQDSKE
jgi:hypothetical protein